MLDSELSSLWFRNGFTIQEWNERGSEFVGKYLLNSSIKFWRWFKISGWMNSANNSLFVSISFVRENAVRMPPLCSKRRSNSFADLASASSNRSMIRKCRPNMQEWSANFGRLFSVAKFLQSVFPLSPFSFFVVYLSIFSLRCNAWNMFSILRITHVSEKEFFRVRANEYQREIEDSGVHSPFLCKWVRKYDCEAHSTLCCL